MSLPSAEGPQCPAPRAPAFPTAAETSGTNETRSRAAARDEEEEEEEDRSPFPSSVSTPPDALPAVSSLPRAFHPQPISVCLAGACGPVFPGKRSPREAPTRGACGGWFSLMQLKVLDAVARMKAAFLPPSSYPPQREAVYPFELTSATLCHRKDQGIGADAEPQLPVAIVTFAGSPAGIYTQASHWGLTPFLLPW